MIAYPALHDWRFEEQTISFTIQRQAVVGQSGRPVRQGNMIVELRVAGKTSTPSIRLISVSGKTGCITGGAC
jgi:hypothetical protein